MASPAEIAKGLPETLPEDFGEWDNEPSSATVANSSGGFEDTRSPGKGGKGPSPIPEPGAPAPLVDWLSDAALPSHRGDFAHDAAFVNWQASLSPKATRVPDSASHRAETALSTHEVSFQTQRPNMADGVGDVMEIPVAATPNLDEFLLPLRSKIAATKDEKQPRKKWMLVAAVSACSILVLVILALRLSVAGTSSTQKKAAEPGLTTTEAQLTNTTPKPSPSKPLTEEQAPSPTQTQPAPGSQLTEAAEEDTSPVVDSKMMNDQLTAPTRIPKDLSKSSAESEPPSARFGTNGTEGLGGSSPVASVFKGEPRPIVHPAPSNPVTISAGVAVGMLIQKVTPVYPPIAKAARVSGTVEIQATISKLGTIKDMRVVRGPDMLRQAALDAVRTWRYQPYKLNNEPTEVQTTINVIFSFGG